MSNNPLRYTDPSGHKLWEDDNGNYTQADAEYNRQRLDSLQCQAGNETYCSYGELHPVETAAFVFGGLVGGTALEAFVMEGAVRWGAVQACVGISACRSVLVYVVALLSTKKPFGGQTVIGSYPEYKNYATASGNTYFDMGTLWNNFESQGLSSLNPEINAKFMDIQIYLVKDFLQVNKGEPSTAIEVKMLLQAGYKLVEPIFSGIYQQFQYP